MKHRTPSWLDKQNTKHGKSAISRLLQQVKNTWVRKSSIPSLKPATHYNINEKTIATRETIKLQTKHVVGESEMTEKTTEDHHTCIPPPCRYKRTITAEANVVIETLLPSKKK